MPIDSPKARENNFGLIRLCLACFVIFSHSSELIDGNRAREPLVWLFGSVSLGGLAVDGFFIISGFLITRSWIERPVLFTYLIKRVARIIPGYIASFIICSMILATFVGAGLSPFRPFEILRLCTEMIRLLAPSVPGAFSGLSYAALNGSMWTIAYEMRCYLIAALFGVAGLYGARTRYLYLCITAGLLAATVSDVPARLPHQAGSLIGEPALMCRLAGVFAVGAVFFLFRQHISLSIRGATVSVILLIAALYSDSLIEPTIAIAGGYIIFWFALGCKVTRFANKTNRIDISYGVYLYAFPIQNLLIWAFRIDSPLLLSGLALPLSILAGFASWTFVERPAMNVVKTWMTPAAASVGQRRHRLSTN